MVALLGVACLVRAKHEFRIGNPNRNQVTLSEITAKHCELFFSDNRRVCMTLR